ncbi:MAG: DUF4130 domain-containing protein [Alcanivorax sp.]|nr:DUF4130 domain-containing protein [Alcanivorax sp.]
MDVTRKLAVLADAAKYDASCASSGAPRRSSRGTAGLGNSNGTGICHSYTPDAGEGPAPRVPAALVAALRQAAPYRVAGRWNLLYRVLWRGVHGERQAHLPGDQDGSALQRRIKAVQREAHHLHAFLRFQPVADDDPQRPLDLLAWFNPARLNPTAMQGHMPARFRADTPEGRDIPGLVADARRGARRHGQAAAVGALPGKALRAPKSPGAPPPPGALK